MLKDLKKEVDENINNTYVPDKRAVPSRLEV